LSQKPISRQKNAEKSTESNGGIFLSTDSKEIQTRISRPLSARRPVGYQKKLIDEIFGQVLDAAVAISDPFEQAFFIIVHLPYLQPFEDVNKLWLIPQNPNLSKISKNRFHREYLRDIKF
jgi:hypothetical protein